MRKYTVYIILFLYAIGAALTILFFNGTGDSGDSIQHYLFAKFAPDHPKLYFDHWAKPVYILLASPFARFGFTGVKIFNAIITLLTIFFTFRTALNLQLKNPIMSVIILLFSPLYYILTFSGLTEPLFALFISISLYAIVKQKFLAACIVISFLPFVRSEGLIIAGIFGLYFILKREWKVIPMLLTGHIVYAFAGFFVYHDLLWVFDKIPYTYMSSTYGSGNLFHFVTQMIYVTGVPVYILFWLGVISIVWKSVKKQLLPEMQILVFLGFFAFFIAQSLFWYFGIFNSMGLKRVLIGVIPMISLISLEGFNFLTSDIFKEKTKFGLFAKGLLTAYIVIFPFTGNPAAINWEKDMKLSSDQQTAIKIADYIKKKTGTGHRFVFGHPYLSEALKIDPFDSGKHLELTPSSLKNTRSGDIIIWENWFCGVGNGVTKEYLDKDPELVPICNLSATDRGREVLYSVYERK